jgi:hypothetical protein
MIELSILMGNDYTGPFLVGEENGKKRRKYWESLRWHRPDGGDDDGDGGGDGGGSGERLPPEDELDRLDARAVADHVTEMHGWRLASDKPELMRAIRYSYELYSFGDVRGLSSQSTDVSCPTEEEEEDDHDHRASVDRVFPSLPRGLDLSPSTRVASAAAAAAAVGICEAALSPLITYMTENADFNDVGYVGRRHLDAFRMTLDKVGKDENGQQRRGMTTMAMDDERPAPLQRLNWDDMRALYVLERCLLSAIECADGTMMPCQIFSHSVFCSCLEDISFELDRRDDEQLVAEIEKLSLEVTTSAPVHNPSLPIDEHKEDILNTVKSQRVTIIHGETGESPFFV